MGWLACLGFTWLVMSVRLIQVWPSSRLYMANVWIRLAGLPGTWISPLVRSRTL